MDKPSLDDYKKLTYDNENNILSYYRDSDDQILAFPQSEIIKTVYQSTHNAETWQMWVDSAGKADKTPDFYCDELQMMMEVMRFDDKADRRGKVNHTLARESKMHKELADAGILETFSNAKHIITNAVTDLPTDEDHNFSRFRSNFVRVIESHSKKVETYRRNHPDFKLIFFIFDETFCVYGKKIKKGQSKCHFYWKDSVLVKAIKDSNADYVIWYKPYNSYLTINEVRKDDLPKIIIYDVANMNVDPISYNVNQMISSEV